ncbi:MAG: TIGR04002 family protein [Clostridia bacterium]|nr:TIGR04002 family protein [Clostridia bacterium]
MAKKSDSLKYIVSAAAFAALTMIMTAYLFHLPVGTNGGYVHFGDTMIFMAACCLPFPYAMTAAAVGGGLADLLTAPLWALPTVIIKSVMAFCFTSKNKNIICLRNVLGLPIAVAWTVFGYYVAEALLFGSWGVPLAGIPGNLIQGFGSAALFLVFGKAADHFGLRRRLFS